jgi:hypothetical protein
VKHVGVDHVTAGEYTLDEQALRDVNAAIPVLEEHGDAEEAEQGLIEMGFAQRKARRLAVFVPSAFGSIAANKLGVEVSMIRSIKNRAGDFVTFDVRSEPYFLAGLAIATALFDRDDRDTLMKIAAPSAELNAIDQALRAGETLESIAGAKQATVYTEILIEELDGSVGRS